MRHVPLVAEITPSSGSTSLAERVMYHCVESRSSNYAVEKPSSFSTCSTNSDASQSGEALRSPFSVASSVASPLSHALEARPMATLAAPQKRVLSWPNTASPCSYDHAMNCSSSAPQSSRHNPTKIAFPTGYAGMLRASITQHIKQQATGKEAVNADAGKKTKATLELRANHTMRHQNVAHPRSLKRGFDAPDGGDSLSNFCGPQHENEHASNTRRTRTVSRTQPLCSNNIDPRRHGVRDRMEKGRDEPQRDDNLCKKSKSKTIHVLKRGKKKDCVARTAVVEKATPPNMGDAAMGSAARDRFVKRPGTVKTIVKPEGTVDCAQNGKRVLSHDSPRARKMPANFQAGPARPVSKKYVPLRCNVEGCDIASRSLFVKVFDTLGDAGPRCGRHGGRRYCTVPTCYNIGLLTCCEDDIGPTGRRCLEHALCASVSDTYLNELADKCDLTGCHLPAKVKIRGPEGRYHGKCALHMRKECSVPGCHYAARGVTKEADMHGFPGPRCGKHGAAWKCTIKGCPNQARITVKEADEFGLPGARCAVLHGGLRCVVPGCKKIGRSRVAVRDIYGEPGFRCMKHNRPYCSVPGCPFIAKGPEKSADEFGPRGKRCKYHGAARCNVQGCAGRGERNVRTVDEFGKPGPRCQYHIGRKKTVRTRTRARDCRARSSRTTWRPERRVRARAHGAPRASADAIRPSRERSSERWDVGPSMSGRPTVEGDASRTRETPVYEWEEKTPQHCALDDVDPVLLANDNELQTDSWFLQSHAPCLFPFN